MPRVDRLLQNGPGVSCVVLFPFPPPGLALDAPEPPHAFAADVVELRETDVRPPLLQSKLAVFTLADHPADFPVGLRGRPSGVFEDGEGLSPDCILLGRGESEGVYTALAFLAADFSARGAPREELLLSEGAAVFAAVVPVRCESALHHPSLPIHAQPLEKSLRGVPQHLLVAQEKVLPVVFAIEALVVDEARLGTAFHLERLVIEE